jgi:hypothetical protein
MFALSTDAYMYADTKDSSSSYFVSKYIRLFLLNGRSTNSSALNAGEASGPGLPSERRFLVDMSFYYHVSRLLLIPMVLNLISPGLLYILRSRKVLPEVFADVMQIITYGYNEVRRCHLIGNNLDILCSVHSSLQSIYSSTTGLL